MMEMNDFDMIFGHDFLKGNNAIVVPFCDEIMLIGGSQTWTFFTHKKRKEVKVQHVSTLSMSSVMQD